MAVELGRLDGWSASGGEHHCHPWDPEGQAHDAGQLLWKLRPLNTSLFLTVSDDFFYWGG
ncbi:hypothetical protein EYF80_054015 [Liparis tanakae]|uniref:Uncharacterized protein n=1 Tax=Liparis tanakae TaxID=230148 RepID=A0A4Z2F426_9TELE|nr:hypothetical protein EYF80_054015 [Liparis tanakae]